MASKVILEATDAVGDSFRLDGEFKQIHMHTHNGGTWTLQVARAEADPTDDDNWVDTNIGFVDKGIKRFGSSPDVQYRMHGGTLGGAADVVDETPSGIADPTRIP